jgi:hypothetical protein
MAVRIEVEGTFGTRAAAAEALREAANLVLSGVWQGSQASDANPTVFITEVDEDDEEA